MRRKQSAVVKKRRRGFSRMNADQKLNPRLSAKSAAKSNRAMLESIARLANGFG